MNECLLPLLALKAQFSNPSLTLFCSPACIKLPLAPWLRFRIFRMFGQDFRLINFPTRPPGMGPLSFGKVLNPKKSAIYGGHAKGERATLDT
jgi:hypothetical protein